MTVEFLGKNIIKRYEFRPHFFSKGGNYEWITRWISDSIFYTCELDNEFKIGDKVNINNETVEIIDKIYNLDGNIQYKTSKVLSCKEK